MDKLGEVIDSVIQMSNLEEKANKKYKEILVLDKMLTDSHIPHKKEAMFGVGTSVIRAKKIPFAL